MSRAVCAKLHEHEGRMRERTVRGGLCEYGSVGAVREEGSVKRGLCEGRAV
jgi:hypothetical protein